MKFQSEKIILDFSVKKCEKNRIYQISIETEDKSLGLNETFKTEELKCDKDNIDLFFKKTLILNFNFTRNQKLKIKFVKKIEKYQENNKRHSELSAIISSPNAIYERTFNEKNKNKDIFCIKANREKDKNENKDTIFEFLKSGIKLNVFIAYDFSQGTNKKPRKMSLRNYSDLTKTLIIPIYRYLKRQSIYLYGYGGIKENSKSNEDLFNIYSDEDKPISFDKVTSNYMKESIQDVKEPKKSVFLSKLIRKVTKTIYKIYELINFNVLFIFAKELPDNKDKQELIDSIIESSYLPLIIIIIGEGTNDFGKFKEFFGEKIKRASNGMEKNRNNILYFTSEGNEAFLSSWCLDAISKHILEFYDLTKCKPEQIWTNNMEAIQKSYINYNKISVCIFESYFGKSKMNSISSSISGNILEEIREKKDEDFDNNEINLSKDNQRNDNINNININDNKNNDKIEEKIEQKIDENKKEKEEEIQEKKFILTPGPSICTFLPNPYNKENQEEEEDSQTKEKRVLIQNDSIATSIMQINPFNSAKNEQKQYRDSKFDSSTSTIENSKFSNMDKK